jgi:NitT/TauT family transport system permease protein
MDFGFNLNRTANASAWRLLPNRWDFVAFPLIISLIAMAAIGFHQTMAPIATLKTQVISLDPSNLPEYALRTTLRMLAAMFASLVFTLIYGTLAAKNRRAEKVLVPILDILQSVPVLGYISFTVTFFIALFPTRVAGAECAAIFAIFTSQAWNMTFSFYQSLRTTPRDLDEVARSFHLTAWQRFLEAGGTLLHARPHLEHDDVHVGGMVLCGCIRSHHGRQQYDHAAGHRCVSRAGHH